MDSYGGSGWVSTHINLARKLQRRIKLTDLNFSQANVTILEGKTHGGNYQTREIWNYLEFLNDWFESHAPGGSTPIPANATTSAARGNLWEDVIRSSGRQAALDRQARPTLANTGKGYGGRTLEAEVGRWDPGVKLEAQWWVGEECQGGSFDVVQGQKVEYVHERRGRGRGGAVSVMLQVTGRKMGYVKETRRSNTVSL